MRRLALVAALALAACGQSEPPPPLPQAETAVANTATPPWFICDAIDAPVVLVFRRDGESVEVAQYDKPNGALIERTSYGLGAGDGAAGSVYTALQQNGADVGHVREVNAGMIENPASAYTPLSSVRLGDRDISCRWLPRTRLLGFTGRRSFVVHEDRDGDLIYTTYDFTAASSAQPVELSENGRSTTFSVEVRGGEETVSANGAEYRFAGQNGFSYVISLDSAGAGRLDVLRDGVTVQSEPLAAFVQGDAAAQ